MSCGAITRLTVHDQRKKEGTSIPRKNIDRRKFIGITGALLGGVAFGSWYSRHLTENPFAQPVTGPPEPAVVTPQNWDTLLWNGLVVDGTGNPAYPGFVAFGQNQITAVERTDHARIEAGQLVTAEKIYSLPAGCEVIDVQNNCICPGFIDIHTHNEVYLRTNPAAEIRLHQGITTQIGGNCGDSVDNLPAFKKQLGTLGLNYAQLAGYLNLRQRVLGGKTARTATGREIDQMVSLLTEQLDQGAPGMSIALEYSPQSAITTAELKRYAQVLADRGKLLTVHLRSESDGLLESFAAIVNLAKDTGVAIQYSHIKALFSRNWAKFPRLLEKLTEAAAEVDIWADVYVYDYSSWDFGTNRVSISEDNICAALTHPRVFIGSDAGLYENGRVNHARACGNFPRVLARYVREKKVLSLESAISKMSYLPANRFKITDRGHLAPGKKADIVVFSPAEIQDQATRTKPGLLPLGIQFVFVNGVKAINNGSPAKTRSGVWLA
ncbi:MAG: amidohydrolase family protein [Heliobacteriaceae bacterium]|nr:amidohydrolase family protein [Heliobacteriaceae bacterium]MDD4588493.1 amidohydrolase family protein [Heliobacteriaceae bacterium]